MTAHEHEFEPVRGLPAPLPDGEEIVWQGEPRWGSMARHVFRVRTVMIYFAVLVLWRIVSMAYDGFPVSDIAVSVAILAGVGAAGVAVLMLLAWANARTTIYTFTNRRVIFRFGVALTMSINIPYNLIKSASVKADGNGVGDIALALTGTHRIAYLLMWPNVRPWHFSASQPALRAIADVEAVSARLARLLAQSTAPVADDAPAEPRQPVDRTTSGDDGTAALISAAR